MKRLSLYQPILIVGVLMMIIMWSVSVDATSIFINEIHYDNKGADTGEGIEIAGPAGVDLSGWGIVLYNGANGKPYHTELLNGLIPDQENSFGTIFFGITPVQNGSSDGIALIDPADNVVQFLSYEGTLTAVGALLMGLPLLTSGYLNQAAHLLVIHYS